MSHKTFLITGVSSGFGRAFAQAALAAGHTVIGTLRRADAVADFERLHAHNAHGVVLDVSDFAAIEPIVNGLLARHGAIDVLVSNAGYGHEGTLEESPLSELQRQFDVNVYGAVAMIKAVLPGMRERRSGHIINITSMGGMMTLPGISYYHGSKFALEGISESLAQEVEPLGVKVTAVAPGSFRTDWAGRSMVRTHRSIADYDALFDPIRQTREARSGHQPGDPDKAAQALLALVNADKPPRHLLLGADALQLVRAKLKALQAEIDEWESLSASTGY